MFHASEKPRSIFKLEKNISFFSRLFFGWSKPQAES
jgi:hypothetical protein